MPRQPITPHEVNDLTVENGQMSPPETGNFDRAGWSAPQVGSLIASLAQYQHAIRQNLMNASPCLNPGTNLILNKDEGVVGTLTPHSLRQNTRTLRPVGPRRLITVRLHSIAQDQLGQYRHHQHHECEPTFDRCETVPCWSGKQYQPQH